MCIDRPDHVKNGRPALSSTKGWEPLFQGATWTDVAAWLTENGLLDCDEVSTEARAAAAQCLVRDWANDYGHQEVDGALVIYGQDLDACPDEDDAAESDA